MSVPATDADVLATLDFTTTCQSRRAGGCVKPADGVAALTCPHCDDRQAVPLCGEHYRLMVRMLAAHAPGFACLNCDRDIDLEHITWRPL